MKYYNPDNNEKGKLAGAIATAVYVVLCLVVFLFVRFDTDYNIADEGIMIDFGTSETGSGDEKASLAQNTAVSSSPEEIITQDFEEASLIRVRSREQRRAEQDRQSQTTETETPREVNRRALFPGRNSDSQSQGHGSGTEQGVQGSPEGAQGSADGTGSGNSGISFSLQGRGIAGELVYPLYPAENKQGTVVIEITVDEKGNVVSADFRPQGSTTQDRELVTAAEQAAMRTRFTPDEDNFVQKGTITYVFRLVN